jgi:hypothetical protein
MKPSGLLVLAFLLGCEPPPEVAVGGGPGVRVAFPPQSNDEGTGPFEVARIDGTSDWSLFFVIDVDNFTLVDPYLEENDENRAGQGHWHLVVSGTETPVPGTSFTTLALAADDFSDDQLVTLTASLKNNDHSQVNDEDGEPVESSVEVKLVGPP